VPPGVIHKYNPVLGNFLGDIGAGQLTAPQGMTADATGVYVADPGNGRIVKFDANGNVLGTWTMPTYTVVAGGSTFNGRIEPHDVAVDGSGRVFAPDAGTHSNLVAVFGANGTLQQIFGSPDSDPGNACTFDAPWGLAVNGSTLYVVSTGENRVRVLDDAVLHARLSTSSPAAASRRPRAARAAVAARDRIGFGRRSSSPVSPRAAPVTTSPSRSTRATMSCSSASPCS
jgi:sugar lactone lactonase YvrE